MTVELRQNFKIAWDTLRANGSRSILTILGIVIGVLLLLLVSAVANTMVMTVHERVREIGTMLALGIRREKVVLLLAWDATGGDLWAAGLFGTPFGFPLRQNWWLTAVVHQGGKNLSFSALVVVGDGHGVVGFGIGKAKEVPSAIKKAIEAAKKSLVERQRSPATPAMIRTTASCVSAVTWSEWPARSPASRCAAIRRSSP